MQQFYGIELEYWQFVSDRVETRSEIHAVVLFGSRAKGTHQNPSDIDLALLAQNYTSVLPPSLLSSQLDDDLPWEIDLVMLYQLKPDNPIRGHIERVGLVVWTREHGLQLPGIPLLEWSGYMAKPATS